MTSPRWDNIAVANPGSGTQLPVLSPAAPLTFYGNLSSISGQRGDYGVAPVKAALGLKSAAYLDVGTVAGTVAAGDDTRLTDVRVPVDGSVTNAKFANAPANTLKGNLTGSPAGVNDYTTAQIAVALAGTTSTTLAAGNDARLSDQRTPLDASVTNAKLPNVASGTLKARLSAGTGSYEDSTLSQVATALSGTTAGTLAAGNDSRLGDQRTPLDGSVTTAKVVDRNVTNAKLADMPANTIKANLTGSTGVTTDTAVSSLAIALGLGKETVYDTVANATAGGATTDYIRVAEFGVPAQYAYNAAGDPGNKLKFQNAAGRWYYLTSAVLTPKMFGADPAVSDNKQAFQDMAAEIRWRGGNARVEFPDNCTFVVWNVNPAAGIYYLFDFRSVNGLTVNFNGSKITSPVNFGIGIQFYMIYLEDSLNCEFNAPNFEQTFYTTLDSNNGMHAFFVANGSKSIRVSNLRQRYGRSAFGISRVAGFSNANRARDFILNGMDIDGVYYGINCQRNGDQLVARNVLIRNSGRSYFPYNVKMHDVEIDSNFSGPFDDCLLKVYADNTEANEYNELCDIKLLYRNRNRAVANPGTGSLVRLAVQQLNATPATYAGLRNIKIAFDVENGASFGHPPLLTTSKFDSAGAVDNAARGIFVSNLEVSGYAGGWNYGTPALQMFRTADGDYSVEIVENVTFSSLILRGSNSTFEIAAGSIDRNLTYRNVFCEFNKTDLTSPAVGVVNASQNVNFLNYKSHNNADPGYRRLPDGGLECFGTTACAASSNATATFPITFSGTPLVTASRRGAGNTGDWNIDANTTTLTVNRPNGVGTHTFAWVARGYS